MAPWLIRDYRRWWRLPEPLPPPWWPRWLMAVIAGEIMLAVVAGGVELARFTSNIGEASPEADRLLPCTSASAGVSPRAPPAAPMVKAAAGSAP
jgi:hypothetical protein